MIESGYYPDGAEHDPYASYNQVDNPEREIEVTVSITLSKTVKVTVTDYDISACGIDDEGEPFEDIDYSNCDLKKAVMDQITLPNETVEGWGVDDFECIIEE